MISAVCHHVVCKVCFYFIVTFFTRSLVPVAALFVHFAHFLMTTLSTTRPKGASPSCVDTTMKLNEWRKNLGQADQWEQVSSLMFLLPPTFLLLGLFFPIFLMSCLGQVVSSLVLFQWKRLWKKTNERKEKTVSRRFLFIYCLSEGVWTRDAVGWGEVCWRWAPPPFDAALPSVWWCERGRVLLRVDRGKEKMEKLKL